MYKIIIKSIIIKSSLYRIASNVLILQAYFNIICANKYNIIIQL